LTRDQFTLLQDKIALWRRSATEGAMDLRDHNKRAGEALTAALLERAALHEVICDLVDHARPSNWEDDDQDPDGIDAWRGADSAIAMVDGLK